MTDVKNKLLDAADRLSQVRALVEAVYMAAVDISDAKQTNAIQTVCDLADDRIDLVRNILDDLIKNREVPDGSIRKAA